MAGLPAWSSVQMSGRGVLDWHSCLYVALLALLCYCLANYARAVLLVLRLPGPPARPLLGHTLLLIEHAALIDLGKNVYQTFGPLVKIWFTIFPAVLVVTPEYIQPILSSNKHTEKNLFYKLLHSFLGDGLITSSGDKWRSHRRLMQPTFSLSTLERFIVAFDESSRRLARRFKDTSGPVNITSFINNAVLEVLNDTVLGVLPDDSLHSAPEKSPFRQGKVTATYRVLRPWLMFNWLYSLTDVARRETDNQNSLFNFTRKVVQRRKEEREKMKKAGIIGNKGSASKRVHLVDQLIDISETNSSFDEEAVIHELCTLMLAGQESVATAVTYCLFLLAKHPDSLREVRRELEEVLEGSAGRAPSMQQLRRMRYLEQCLKETLRLYPSVPLVARKLSEDLVLGKHTLPAGCDVLITPFATHRIADIYPDPERFDPDRFLPGKVEQRHPYAYLPFSAGPRNCIGHKFAMLEMKSMVSTVVRNFDLSLVPGKENLNIVYRITIRSRGGVWLQFTPRQTGAADL
ncbi:probable cytochrome P450 4aa1 isoform X2 [Bacillus rossius redtenbacheri]|uniref:probable cytochrome P450 4aa1 isoform X2 n=1 Tax=Bacillus rossius redtenbacheri TaxID=93214 RepID=UPI002FDD0F73